MLELPRESFVEVKPLIGDLSHYLVLTALLEGRTPGRIWVNRLGEPTTAFVWDRLNTLFFLMGDSTDNQVNQELNDLILDTIFPEAIQLLYREFYLQLTPHHAWEAVADVILARSIYRQQSIYSYLFDPRRSSLDLGWEPRIPIGYHMTRITEELLDNPNLENLDEIVSGIRACWRSTDQYLQSGGIGYCLLKDDVITSWCSTDYVVNAGCELYVETFEGYKRKGLGTLVALTCVLECIAKGLVVHWHCFSYAVGSAKIAERINLVKTADCPVYIVDLRDTRKWLPGAGTVCA